jgi:hypothetical protein
MTIFVFANNVNTTLAGAISNSATSLTLSSTANLPSSIPSGSVLVITLNDVATRQNFEIVYATAITGATLTVLRAQEGTAALAWLTGDFAYSPPTAGQQASFGQLAQANTWTGSNTFNDPVIVPAAVTANEAINLGQGESIFAALAGLATQLFSAAPGVAGSEVVNFGQFVGSLGSSGWLPIPGGFIIQWGGLLTLTSGFENWVFPKQFPTAVFQVFGTPQSSGAATIGASINLSAATTSFVPVAATSSGAFVANELSLFAIGF